jgi:hypothetical protein
MSTKTVAEKLTIKPNSTFWLSHPARLDLIEPLPDNVRVVGGLDKASTALIYADNSNALRAILDEQKDLLTQPAVLWIAYPKANRIDLNRDTLWPILGDYGMRPNGQMAVNDVWSALRFRALNAGEAPFTGGRP